MAPKKKKNGKTAAAKKQSSLKAAPKSKSSRVKKTRAKGRATTTKHTNTAQTPRRSTRLAAPSTQQKGQDDDASSESEANGEDVRIGGVAQTNTAAQLDHAAKEPSTTQADNVVQANEASGDSPGVKALAEVHDIVECSFQGSPARLRTTLLVHQDPQAPPYLLGYRAVLQLDRSSNGKPQWEDAGYIDSWRIDKATAAHPHDKKDAWCREMVAPSIDEAWPDMKQEAAYCLKALYTKKGEPAKKLKNPDREASLASSSLMFVQMTYFNEAFQRQGLLRHALASFYELLGRLPEWLAFAGIVVLVPSRPDGYRSVGWGDQDDDEVAVTLEMVYANAGYQRWVSSVVSETRAVVMGRLVPQGPELTNASNVYCGDEHMI